MRVTRLLSVGLALAVPAVLLTVPTTTAYADTAAGTCEVGIVIPERLAITGYSTSYGVRLTGETSCFFRVTWDVSEGLISTGSAITYYAPSTSSFQSYVGEPAKVHALPAAGASSLQDYVDPATGEKRPYAVIESKSGPMVVKYDSRIAWRKPKRAGRREILSATVASISGASRIFGTYGTWTGEKVRFQRKQGNHWNTVATGRGDEHGIATVSVPWRKGQWRAVSVDTSSTWGRTTSSHRL